MHSIHTTRWIENLKDTSFEMYWFDVLSYGKLETIGNVKQFIDWKKRKIPYIKGEYFLSKNFPTLFKIIEPFFEISINDKLEKIIQEINPDIIHSFEMQSCSYPIYKTMKKYKDINWVYSCWGSDLFYYQNLKEHNFKIKRVLKRLNFLHTDCFRDYEIAINLGFKGTYLGVIPGGSGYKLDELQKLKQPLENRNIITVKGYNHRFARGLVIIQALKEISEELKNFRVIVFGANQDVLEYITQNKLPFIAYNRNELNYNEILELMGKSTIYIGNSTSDGIPNTLLEAIVMGAFPIQSNPGGVTEEIISHGLNGFLIKDSDSVNEIKELILKAISDKSLIQKSIKINTRLAVERLDYQDIQLKIIKFYEKIYTV